MAKSLVQACSSDGIKVQIKSLESIHSWDGSLGPLYRASVCSKVPPEVRSRIEDQMEMMHQPYIGFSRCKNLFVLTVENYSKMESGVTWASPCILC